MHAYYTMKFVRIKNILLTYIFLIKIYVAGGACINIALSM